MNTALTKSERAALKCIWQKDADSRSDLAKLLKLSRPTASVLAKSLIDKKYLSEDGCLHSSGGKPAIRLKINADSFHAIGIDIGYENSVRALRLDAAGNISKSVELPANSDYANRTEAIKQALSKLMTPETCGIGIAVSGIVEPKSGKIIQSAHFELENHPLIKEISEFSGLPVCIDNRARMAARAEQFSGSARGTPDFLLVSLGKGIGSAISFNGKLHCGVSGKSGELRGLIVPDYNTRRPTTLENALQEHTIEQHDYPCKKMAEICAYGFRQVLNIIDLDVIILAGRFALFPEDFRKALAKLMPDVELRLSQFGRDSGACGSAVASIEHVFFNSPLT